MPRESWEHLLTAAIAQQEIDPDRTQSLATLIVASIEGAVVLARAQHSTAPLERVAQELRALVTAILPTKT